MIKYLDAFLDGIKNTAKANKENKSAGAEAKDLATEDNKRALIEDLGEIEEAYKKSPYKTYDGAKIANLQELEYDAPTDEEILRAAEEIYGKAKEESSAKLKSTASEKISGLENSKTRASETADASAAKIAEAAEKAKTDAENQALKRGIGRSSIILEELNGIDNSALKATGEVYGDLQKEIASIDDKIYALQDDLGAALDKLDVDTATKINNKVKELKAEREEKLMAVTKYNNDIKANTAKAMTNAAKAGADIAEENSDEYITQNSEKIKRLYSYYYDFGDDAIEEIEKDKDFITSHVGLSGYNYLRNTLFK